jgi:hypothetical protein
MSFYVCSQNICNTHSHNFTIFSLVKNQPLLCSIHYKPILSQPYFERVWGWDSHSRNGDLGVLRDSRKFRLRLHGSQHLALGRSLYHWKAIKCRCRKWACLSHLDIYNISYGQKKGRKSNWQFDSRPLKVKNPPNPNAYRWNETHRWKALDESYNFFFRPCPDLRSKQRVIVPQSCESPNLGSFGTLPWESLDKKPFKCGCRVEAQRILYGGRWWLPVRWLSVPLLPVLQGDYAWKHKCY